MKSMFILVAGQFARITRRECRFVAESSCRKTQTEWMMTVRNLMLAGFCMLAMVGCGDWTGPADGKKAPDGPSVQKDAGEYFNALADCVGKTCFDTAQLKRLEVIGRRMEWITAADEASFDSSFPDSSTKTRQLTADDAATLRGLK